MENKNIFHERLTELMIEKGLNTVSLAAANRRKRRNGAQMEKRAKRYFAFSACESCRLFSLLS